MTMSFKHDSEASRGSHSYRDLLVSLSSKPGFDSKPGAATAWDKAMTCPDADARLRENLHKYLHALHETTAPRIPLVKRG